MFKGKNFNMLLVIIFIILTIYITVQLIYLPEKVLSSIGTIHTVDVEKVSQALRSIYYELLAELLVMILLIVKLSFNNIIDKEENKIYTPKYINQDNTESLKEGQDLKSLSEEQLEKVKNILEKKELEAKEKISKSIEIICNGVEATIGAIYVSVNEEEKKFIEFIVGYAFQLPESHKLRYEYGDGLAGQVAKSGNTINITSVPEGYIQVVSGLGKAAPNNLIIFPLINETEVIGVMEIAAFRKFSDENINYLENVSKIIAPEILKYQSLCSKV